MRDGAGEIGGSRAALAELRQQLGAGYQTIHVIGMAGQILVQLRPGLGVAPGFKQELAASKLNLGEPGIELSRTVIVGLGQLPVRMRAIEFAAQQIQRGFLWSGFDAFGHAVD